MTPRERPAVVSGSMGAGTMPNRSQHSVSPVVGPAPSQALTRILDGNTFRQVDRLKRFLRFIVTETLDGRGDQLKEYVIGVQVFDKESSFDPRADPIVRVQARRLRSRLARYYREEGVSDPLVIELPKGGYTPVFRPRDVSTPVRRSLGAALAGHNTIAVASIADHSQGRELEFFCQGLRQEIVHALAQSPMLRVLTTPASDRDAALAPDGPSPAMTLTGGVRSAGDRLRVTIHLTDNLTGCCLWSHSLDGRAADPLALQDGVAAAVMAEIEPRLRTTDRRRGQRGPVENLAARNLYLQGRYHLNQRTDEGLIKAVDFFEKAIVEDAQYAAAHSGLADAYSLLAHYGVVGPAKAWSRAASLAATAVLLDGNCAEARTSLAHVKATQDWDWVGAEREFLLAIELEPLYATAHHWYAASCLVPMGRVDEALDEMLLAQSLDPVSSIVARDLALVHVYRQDLEAALDQCDHAIALNPHFSPAYWALGFTQEQRRDLDEATAAFQRAIHLSPDSPRMHAALARAYALSGKRAPAVTLLKKLEAMAQQRYVSPFEFAVIRLALGEEEEAFEWLAQAARDRAFDLIALRVDPRFDAYRDDPRLRPVLADLGFAT
jgi:TolB-like protein/Flp pilus assembly protein TadD